MSVFISILKLSPSNLELLQLYPEAGEILPYSDEIEHPDDWATKIKIIVGKQGLARLAPVSDRIPHLVEELKGTSAESVKGGLLFLYEDFEEVTTPEEIEYLISMNLRAHAFDYLDSELSYWTAEDVARIAEIISRIDNPFTEAYTEAYEDEVDPFTYIIDAARGDYAMLLTLC